MKRNLLTAPLRFWRHLGYHREIIKHLRWTRVTPGGSRSIRARSGPGELVFDIGANMGNRSKIFRAIGAPRRRVRTTELLRDLSAPPFSGDSDFILVQTAMSDCEGEQEMFLSDTHVLSTLNTDWLERMRQADALQSSTGTARRPFHSPHWTRRSKDSASPISSRSTSRVTNSR